MLHLLNVQQRAFFAQQRNDFVVGFKDVHTVQIRIGTRQVCAVRANRVSDFQTVFLADDVVIRTVTASGMDRTGTRVQRNVIAKDSRHVKAHKRMGKAQQFQLSAFHGAENGVFSRANTLHDAFNQIFRQNHSLAVNLHQRIVKIRCQRDCAVRR